MALRASLAFGLALGSVHAGIASPSETTRLRLRLCSGGALEGWVVEATDHGIVLVHDDVPHVFSWMEVDGGSAVVAKRTLLAAKRGGASHLTAEDRFELGQYALSRSRGVLAGTEFREAKRLDAAYERPVEEALAEFRQRRDTGANPVHPLDQYALADEKDEQPGSTLREVESVGVDRFVPQVAARTREQVMDVYRAFGEKVREVIGRDIVLVETDHFLIWTDWGKRTRPRLASWCESMYAALCQQFGISRATPVFLAKCPVFCFRSKARFRRFARHFDGHADKQAIGYARSIAENGHVHLALWRPGRSEKDLQRFACTLVHEGTHAFLHRLYSTRLIPHWINEGYADLTAQRVIGDACPNAGNARLLARQYVRFGWPINDLLRTSGPIAVHEYPIAHSVVAYLESLGQARFAGLIKSIKQGQSVTDALADHYDGLSLDALETAWRESIRRTTLTGAAG